MVISRNERVVIVGAGCFGISTAYHLLQRGFTDVTVLDRSERLPAPDAANTDLNKSERTCPPSSHFSKKSDNKAVLKNKSCARAIPTYFIRNLLGMLSKSGRRQMSGGARTESNSISPLPLVSPSSER
jgi:glycerol-3-phosphate dehydrogenase